MTSDEMTGKSIAIFDFQTSVRFEPSIAVGHLIKT